MAAHRELGAWGEKVAKWILRKRGYRIVAENFFTPRGEIDLVAREDGTLVFIEVKTRSTDRYGYPQEAVSQRKRQKIVKIAKYFIRLHCPAFQRIRFDVISIFYSREERKVRYRILKHAFDARGVGV